jgi:putative phosphoribosyl transferase
MALSIQRDKVSVQLDKMEMEAVLWLPPDALGVVLFANCSVGSRLTPPNDYVGSVLRGVRLGTLWLDLLSPDESGNREQRPAIGTLVQRLEAGCRWLSTHAATADLPVGLFGTSEAAAAALQYAATRPRCVCAVVTRGARVDLAADAALSEINVPTLLIVGGLDDGMVPVNRAAYAALRCKKRLEIVPGATHAFEEPGSPEVVARHARGWFLQHAHFAPVQ